MSCENCVTNRPILPCDGSDAGRFHNRVPQQVGCTCGCFAGDPGGVAPERTGAKKTGLCACIQFSIFHLQIEIGRWEPWFRDVASWLVGSRPHVGFCVMLHEFHEPTTSKEARNVLQGTRHNKSTIVCCCCCAFSNHSDPIS